MGYSDEGSAFWNNLYKRSLLAEHWVDTVGGEVCLLLCGKIAVEMA
jgi:hypothetical protein